MNREPNNPSKCPICGRSTHKKSKYCIFHASAEEKTEDDFKKALKDYVNEIKKVDGDYNFKRFIFVRNINFKKLNITVFKNASFNGAFFEGSPNLSEATFEGNADLSWATFEGTAFLSEATFEGNADLTGAVFKGYADLRRTTFEGNVYLSVATFEYEADLTGAVFKGDADLSWATFEGYAILSEATFEGNVDLTGAVFKGDADLIEATFEGNAILIEATFEGNVDLTGATFKKKADFRNNKFLSTYIFKGACFEGNVLFSNSILSTGNDLNLKVNRKGFVSFKHACIENIFLELDLAKEVQIDFSDSLLRNTRMEKDRIENHILQEKMKQFSKAKEIYLLLKNNFHSIGQYDDESWAFKKEKDMERKSYYINAFAKNIERKEEKNEEKDQKVKKSKVILYSNWMKAKEFGKWLWSCFCNAIYGYGEKPKNVIISAGIIIIFFALLFSSIGISNPEIIDLKGITVDQNTGNIVDSASKGLLKNNIIRNIPDSLYFSLITFTTLGYGDFRPLEGWGRILAGSEAFIGAFMMALFVYTFARRTGGR